MLLQRQRLKHASDLRQCCLCEHHSQPFGRPWLRTWWPLWLRKMKPPRYSTSSLSPMMLVLCCRPYAEKRSCNVRGSNMPQISDSAVSVRTIANHLDALGFGHGGLGVCALSQDPDGIFGTSSKRQGKDERDPSCSIKADLLPICHLSFDTPHHTPSAHTFNTPFHYVLPSTTHTS